MKIKDSVPEMQNVAHFQPITTLTRLLRSIIVVCFDWFENGPHF